MLVPSRTDTTWWHELVMPRASAVRFVRGRLKFLGPTVKASAPFPSAVLVFRRRRPAGDVKYSVINPPRNGRGVAKHGVTS